MLSMTGSTGPNSRGNPHRLGSLALFGGAASLTHFYHISLGFSRLEVFSPKPPPIEDEAWSDALTVSLANGMFASQGLASMSEG